MTRFITGVRCDTALSVTLHPTMGVTLLANELRGGSTHMEAPGERSAQASALYNLIRPDAPFSIDHPDRPKEDEILRARLTSLSSKTITKVCNSMIGHMGRLNVALAVKSFTNVEAAIKLPPKIVPLAALFVSFLHLN